MRIAGKILGKTLKILRDEVRPGISGLDLNNRAEEIIKSFGGECAFLGYRPSGAGRPFPAALCVSLNDVVVHGVPNRQRIKNGDLVKLDLGVRVQGYYADAAISVTVGSVDDDVMTLVEATKQALLKGIRAARPGKTLGDIGAAIEAIAETHGVSVIKGLTGHGIGTDLHEDPIVYNEGKPNTGMKLRPGMTIAIEPMFSLGSKHVVQKKDESYATSDHALAAHFEHTVLIGEKQTEILTELS